MASRRRALTTLMLMLALLTGCTILDMQVERLTYQLAVMPETRQILADVGWTSRAAEQASPSAKPFNIVEYAEAAREIAKTTRELEGLIRTLDSGAPGVVALTHGAFADAKYLVNHTFWHIAALLVLLVALLFAAAVAYRILFARIGPRGKT